MDIRQAAVDAIVADGQPSMVDTKKFENRRVDIVDLGGVISIQWLVAERVAFSHGDSAAYTATTQPVGEDERIVITTGTTLTGGHSTEFGGP